MKKIKGIILRTKAKWKVKGEKSSKYFFNLEKRQYTEKIIPKLLKNDGSEINNIKDILQEQSLYYKDLYDSKINNTTVQSNLDDLFFNAENSFLNKLSLEESANLEGILTKHECLSTLKDMKK